MATIDKGLFRQVMGHFATGVTVITTAVEDEVHAMTVNAFMAGSLEPPLCVASINRTAQLHDRLLVTRRYGVSILNQEQRYLSNHFGGRPVRGIQPEFVYRADAPVLKNAIATITADVVETHECGDHTLFIGHIDFMELGDSSSPILFYAGSYERIGRGEPIKTMEGPSFW